MSKEFQKTHFKVISLPNSLRRENIVEQLEKTQFLWSFFDAVRELPDDLAFSQEKARVIRGRYLEKGELGCFGSHYLLWKQLLNDESATSYIVLEDDVVINAGFFELMLSRMSQFPSDLHYFRLHAKVPAQILSKSPFMDRFLVEFGEIAFGTQAYYIDKHAAARYLKSITEVVRPIDDEMDRSWAHGVPNLCVFPHPVFELCLPSTIESNRRGLVPPQGMNRLRWLWNRTIEKFAKIRYRILRRVTTIHSISSSTVRN